MTSYADVIVPSSKPRAYIYNFLCIVAGSLFIALMAQLSLHLWFTPVPITMQSFAILMIGALLGPKRGSLAVLAYIAEGACGVPVLAGGMSSLAVILGPTGGYFLGFVVCAFLVGVLLERGWKQSYMMTMIALVVGTAAILAIGACWLSMYVGGGNALAMGIYPFLVGDLLKIVIAAVLIASGWKVLT